VDGQPQLLSLRVWIGVQLIRLRKLVVIQHQPAVAEDQGQSSAQWLAGITERVGR
jgi:hypothetical protein